MIVKSSRTFIWSSTDGCCGREVEVVRVVNVTEECGQQAEYCQLDLRTQAISQETILCQQPGDVVSIAAAQQLPSH